MSTFPTGAQLTSSSNTVAQQKAYISDQADATSQLIGASTIGAYTIATGVITPSVAVFTVDTEAAAASDDLTNILTTNLHSGAIIAIASLNSGRVVTVKHNSGGAGQITLDGAVDRVLSTDEWMLLLRSGSDWIELALNQVPPGSVVTTQGDLIIGNVSGEESRLAVGTAGQVLTADGTTVDWQDPAGGGMWEYVTTVTASNDATIDFTGLSTTYDYKVICQQLTPVTLGSKLVVLTGYGSTTWLATGYDVASSSIRSAATPTIVYANNTTSCIVSHTQTNTTSIPMATEIEVLTDSRTRLLWRTVGYATGATNFFDNGGALIDDINAFTGLRFYFDLGNIFSGNFYFYRRAK